MTLSNFNFKIIISPQLEIKHTFNVWGLGPRDWGSRLRRGTGREKDVGSNPRKKKQNRVAEGGERSEPPKWDTRIVVTVA